MTTDLVCGMTVDPVSAPAKTIYAGNEYSFCAAYCREAFERNPQKYIDEDIQWSESVDPVCGRSVPVPTAEAMSVHQGEFIYFCSKACKTQFDVFPEKFLKVRHEPRSDPDRFLEVSKVIGFPTVETRQAEREHVGMRERRSRETMMLFVFSPIFATVLFLFLPFWIALPIYVPILVLGAVANFIMMKPERSDKDLNQKRIKPAADKSNPKKEAYRI